MNQEKNNVDIIVGSNMRNAREARMLSRNELADLMDLTCSHIGLIERGERGVTAVNLLKLSKVLNVPVGRFFLDPPKRVSSSWTESEKDLATKGKEKIINLMATLSDEELAPVTSVVKQLVTMKSQYETQKKLNS